MTDLPIDVSKEDQEPRPDWIAPYDPWEAKFSSHYRTSSTERANKVALPDPKVAAA